MYNWAIWYNSHLFTSQTSLSGKSMLAVTNIINRGTEDSLAIFGVGPKKLDDSQWCFQTDALCLTKERRLMQDWQDWQGANVVQVQWLWSNLFSIGSTPSYQILNVVIWYQVKSNSSLLECSVWSQGTWWMERGITHTWWTVQSEWCWIDSSDPKDNAKWTGWGK